LREFIGPNFSIEAMAWRVTRVRDRQKKGRPDLSGLLH